MENILLLLVLLSPAASDPDVVQVKPGDDVALPCQVHNASIRAVEWTRPDLEPEYVFLNRDGRSDPARQHPSFKDRVQLVDRELKDGDMSLNLKNVSSNDAGTYECRVAAGGSRRKRALIETDPISIIQLEVSVSGGGQKRNVGLMVSLPVFAVLLVAVVGMMISKRHTEKILLPAE